MIGTDVAHGRHHKGNNGPSTMETAREELSGRVQEEVRPMIGTDATHGRHPMDKF